MSSTNADKPAGASKLSKHRRFGRIEPTSFGTFDTSVLRSPAPGGAWKPEGAPWRDANFALFWAAQLLSQAGIRMFQNSLLWWIVAGNPGGGGKEGGLFMVLGALPSLLLIRAVGRATDRARIKPLFVLFCAMSAAAAAAGALMLKLSWLTPAWAYALGFLLASFQAFLDPAFNKALCEVVRPESLEEAVALQAASQPMAYFAGAVAGAALIDSLGMAGVAGLNAAVYLAAALCCAAVGFPHAAVRGDAQGTPAGWDFLRAMPLIRRVLVAFGLVNFFATPTLLILPFYVSRTLKAGPSTLAGLEASLWIGLLAGTFASKRIEVRGGVLRLGFACLAVFGACLFLPGLIVHAAFYGLMLLAAGFALGVNNVKFMTFFQETVRPEIKGRFFALMQALISFTFPVAYFFFGMLAEALVPQSLCLIQGAGVMVLSLYFFALSVKNARLEGSHA
ncbi:MAG: MFS transporter [Elusimicrobia bacterium]|nr:MFS transporter [Elusimicrobiota bacterium]